jgi:hypothetical protein
LYQYYEPLGYSDAFVSRENRKRFMEFQNGMFTRQERDVADFLKRISRPHFKKMRMRETRAFQRSFTDDERQAAGALLDLRSSSHVARSDTGSSAPSATYDI